MEFQILKLPPYKAVQSEVSSKFLSASSLLEALQVKSIKELKGLKELKADVTLLK